MQSALDLALAKLDPADADVQAYAELRRAQFAVIGRALRFDGRRFSVRLRLGRLGIQKDLESDSNAFHQCANSHLLSTAGLLLRDELPDPSASSLPAGNLTVEIRCGLLAAQTPDLQYFELIEATEPECTRSYRFWVSGTVAAVLAVAPPEPSLHIVVKVNGQVANQLIGYVDRILPFRLGSQTQVEVIGTDGFFGSRIRITARFNSHVDPVPSVTFLAAFAVPSLLAPEVAPAAASIPALDQFLQRPGNDVRKFCDYLAAMAANNQSEAISWLCEVFIGALQMQPQSFSQLTAIAFKNAALLLESKIQPHVVVGSIDGVNVQGVVPVGPGICLAAADSVPVSIVGERRNAPLCSQWNPKSARLLTFCRADSAPQTTSAGWTALKNAFDYILAASSDTNWRHVDCDGTERCFSVDGRIRDATVELDRHYHVHHLFSGVAHQYHFGRQSSSNELVLTHEAAAALNQRIKPLVHGLMAYSTRLPKLVDRLSNAILWVGRARGATSSSEQFLSSWIAIEFLAVSGSETDIKSGVSSRIARLMAGDDRTARRHWHGTMEECYELRCELVHHADARPKNVEKCLTMVMQAVVEVLFFCVLSLPKLNADTTPAGMLDKLRQTRPAGK